MILELHNTNSVDELFYPEDRGDITFESCALEVFTDFKNTEPLVVSPDVDVDEARNLMIQEHVKLKFVVNDSNHFLGVISSKNLSDQKILQSVSLGSKREDLKVLDFMEARDSLMAFSFQDFRKARIIDIVDALQKADSQHALVVDLESHKIRGIVSSSDLARKLKLPVNLDIESNFHGIFKKCKGLYGC